MAISTRALVHPNAKIGKDVRVDPFVTIEENTVIGDRTWIKSHAHINSGTQIGADCRIFQGAIVGGDSQDLKYKGGSTYLKIGNRVTIREFCTLNRSTNIDQATVIGDDCLLMAYVHVAHDCQIGNHVVVANAVNIAGHVRIENHAIIGGMTAVQQFVHIGKHVYIGGGTLIRKDVPPYVRAAREPISYVGVNRVGLERRSFTENEIAQIQDIYRHLFVHHKNLTVGVNSVRHIMQENKYLKEILDFISKSQSGIIRGYRGED